MNLTVPAAFLLLFAMADGASAQVLQRIESAHQTTSSTSTSGSSSGQSGSSTSSSGSSDHSSGGPALFCLLLGPWEGYCFYGDSRLRADRGTNPDPFVPESRKLASLMGGSAARDDQPVFGSARRAAAPRVGELTAGGMFDSSQRVYGLEVGAMGWLGVGGLSANWLSLREPSSPSLTQLDLFRFETATCIVCVRYVESRLFIGFDELHGRAWTPAFGTGLEVLSYPIKHLTAAGSMRVSVFGQGYPLLDSRLEVGVALGRIDLRAGVRWFFQPIEEPCSIAPRVAYSIGTAPCAWSERTQSIWPNPLIVWHGPCDGSSAWLGPA